MFAVIKRGSILEASSYITFSVCRTSLSTTAPPGQKQKIPRFSFIEKFRYKTKKKTTLQKPCTINLAQHWIKKARSR